MLLSDLVKGLPSGRCFSTCVPAAGQEDQVGKEYANLEEAAGAGQQRTAALTTTEGGCSPNDVENAAEYVKGVLRYYTV